MALPFFYIPPIASSGQVILNEFTSKHIVQVLRMKVGEQLHLTDGKGNLYLAEIIDDNRKHCAVTVLQTNHRQPTASFISIAISPLKNATRFEWFFEKAAEIGINEIIPLLTARTEKQHFRMERMQGILVSAMLQSQQTYLTELKEPMKLNELINSATHAQKFIAHCEDENNKISLATQLLPTQPSKLILIGPEGDFTPSEIKLALDHHFIPVTLGETRLRTETAGMVAATLLRLL